MQLAPLLAHVLAAPPKTKFMYVALICGVLALIGGSFAATRDTRIALFATPLTPEQVSEVQTRLAAWNIAITCASRPANAPISCSGFRSPASRTHILRHRPKCSRTPEH
jgi:hypothetical protein